MRHRRHFANRIVLITAALATHPLAPALQASLNPARSITQYVHDVWTSETGLPQSSVLALAQTADGYIWLGTEVGLLRFDGLRFTVFDRRNVPGLQTSEIDALLADRRGVLGIGTRGGGLLSYE